MAIISKTVTSTVLNISDADDGDSKNCTTDDSGNRRRPDTVVVDVRINVGRCSCSCRCPIGNDDACCYLVTVRVIRIRRDERIVVVHVARYISAHDQVSVTWLCRNRNNVHAVDIVTLVAIRNTILWQVVRRLLFGGLNAEIKSNSQTGKCC